MSVEAPRESLYGEDKPVAVVAPPSLLDQVTGVFTDPVALFKRLSVTPVWWGALGLLTALNLVVSVIWASRVDVDAMLRPMLERNPKVSAEALEAAIAFQTHAMLPFAILTGLFALALLSLVVALLYWGLGQVTAEDRPPSYAEAFSATVVSGLVGLPKVLMLGLVCALRNIGGARPDALSPTSLGFYLVPESLKLQALFNGLDLVNLASFLMVYLAARHAMRLKVSGALLCAGLAAALTLGLPILGAR